MSLLKQMQQELLQLEEHSNLRHLPKMTHDGREVIVNNKRMLNLSSNDYLGLASDRALREEFLRTLTPDTFLPSSSSSRLLTGNLQSTKNWKLSYHTFSVRKLPWSSTAVITPTQAFYPLSAMHTP